MVVARVMTTNISTGAPELDLQVAFSVRTKRQMEEVVMYYQVCPRSFSISQKTHASLPKVVFFFFFFHSRLLEIVLVYLFHFFWGLHFPPSLSALKKS